MTDLFDGTVKRNTIYMNVENGHENADFFAATIEERRIINGLHDNNFPVGR